MNWSENQCFQVLVNKSLLLRDSTRVEQQRKTASGLQEKKIYSHQEEKEVVTLQLERKREILLLKRKSHPQNQPNREYHLQLREEKTSLDCSKEKENQLEVEVVYFRTKKSPLQPELEEAHFQQKKQACSHKKLQNSYSFLKDKDKELGWEWEREQNRYTWRSFQQMWLKARHSVCLPKPSVVCSIVRPRISSPLPLVQGQVGIKGEEHEFKVWLKSRGEDEACPILTIGKSAHGRGLFASRPILAGESILRISRKLVITPDKIHDELKYLLDENVSDCARLALLILSEQYAGKASEWAPYMNRLPQLGTLHNTVLWSDAELELLLHSSSYRQSVQSKTNIYQEFATVRHVLQRCPHLFGQSVSLADFLHAYAVVNSRAWGVDEGNTIGLVPFVDFLNHNISCQSFLSFDNDYKNAEVLADKDYASGEQVFINYGRYGNGVLAATFGFTLEINPFDQVEVWMGLSQKDPLCKLKLELFHSHGMPMIPGSGGRDEWGSFFYIREVKALKGRGKGLPQSLRAFARVLCADSKQELFDMARRASQLDGRLAREPLKVAEKELQAMMLLLTRLESLTRDRRAAIMASEMAAFCNVTRGSVPCIRTKMAEDILDGEVRILRSAVNWLKHHCIIVNTLL